MKTYDKEIKNVFVKRLKEVYGENYEKIHEQKNKFERKLLDEIEKQITRNTSIEHLGIGIGFIEKGNIISGCRVDYTIDLRKAYLCTLKNLTDKKRIKEIAKWSVFELKQAYKKWLESELKKINGEDEDFLAWREKVKSGKIE